MPNSTFTPPFWRLDIYAAGGSRILDLEQSSYDEGALRDALLALVADHDLTVTFHHKMMLRAGSLTGSVNGQKVAWFRIINVLPMPAPIMQIGV